MFDDIFVPRLFKPIAEIKIFRWLKSARDKSVKQGLLLATIAPLVVSCTSFHSQPRTAIYLAIATNSPEITTLAQDVLDVASRRTGSHQWMVVDLLKNEGTENIFSHHPSRQAMREMMAQLPQTPSSDRALIQAFYRLTKLAIQHQERKSFYGYVVTAGTQDPETLNAISALFHRIGQQPPSNMRVCVLGLAPENRLKMSAALASVSDRVQFAGTSEREWTPLIGQF